MNQAKILVALVDDHTLFRNGIANLLNEFNDIEILFEAGNGIELKQIITNKTNVDVVLMDINMPGMDGYAATAWLTKNYPQIKVLALSMFDDEMAIIRMLKAGAGGYILKESKPIELHRAIIEVHERGFYMNEIVTGNMIKSLQKADAEVVNITNIQITLREREFMQQCASELTYKEIARNMNVAVRTVDNYREALFFKLKLKTRIGIVLFGLRNGLIKL